MRSDSEEYRKTAAYLAGHACAKCRHPGLRLELRPEAPDDGSILLARPLGSHSLSGHQIKVSALQVQVGAPWAVCPRVQSGKSR